MSKTKTNLSLIGSVVANDLLHQFASGRQTIKGDSERFLLARIERGKIEISVRPTKSADGQRIGTGFFVRAIIDRPTYGGLPTYITRRVSDEKYLRNAVSRTFFEAFKERQKIEMREKFFAKFDERTRRVQHLDSFQNAVEQVEKESKRSSAYADLEIADVEFWSKWLTTVLPQFEVEALDNPANPD